MDAISSTRRQVVPRAGVRPMDAGIIAGSQEKDPKTFRLSQDGSGPGHPGLFRTIDEYLSCPTTVLFALPPGILFLYNVQTRRFYEWDTHDGDCEVLLVKTVRSTIEWTGPSIALGSARRNWIQPNCWWRTRQSRHLLGLFRASHLGASEPTRGRK